jgi:DNA primase
MVRPRPLFSLLVIRGFMLSPKELLDSAGIKYKETSTNLICSCLNPGHIDKKPSMSIHKQTGQFRCFSCQEKGGIKKLYFLVTGRYYKNELDQWSNTHVFPTKRDKEKTISEIKVVGNIYNPLKKKEIRDWLFNYGIENDQFIIDREITYSVYSEMIASHLLVQNPRIEFTKIRDRICSPIYKNNLKINVEARTYLDETPKVLYIKGGSVETFYNWDFINKDKNVIITEGVKGLWRVWNVEQNVIAMFHNLPTDVQIKMLEEIKGNIIFFFDNDRGAKGDQEKKVDGTYQVLLEKLSEETKRRLFWVMSKKEGNDPNDCSYKEIEDLLKKPFSYGVDPNLIYRKRERLV